MNWPLMRDNLSREDIYALVSFLTDDDQPMLTQGAKVAEFEEAFARWVGVPHAVMVNSGASANLVTMHALAMANPYPEQVIVPVIGWSSDITAIINAGLEPVFCDVDQRTFGLDLDRARHMVTDETLAVLAIHCLGFAATSQEFVSDLASRGVALIEDACEAHGAMVGAHKVGSLGLVSNFSFYYGHHMTTIEGGMVCTADADFARRVRMLRNHGMTRGLGMETPHDLDPNFVFDCAGFNVRSTEINAVIGLNQLQRLDLNNAKRQENLSLWLAELDGERYRVDYATEGASSFALPLVLIHKNYDHMNKVCDYLKAQGVEYRRGTAGGGNQLRQPYLKRTYGDIYKQFPQAEHIHNYGLYVGNYPGLVLDDIEALAKGLNAL